MTNAYGLLGEMTLVRYLKGLYHEQTSRSLSMKKPMNKHVAYFFGKYAIKCLCYSRFIQTDQPSLTSIFT